jgi:hypothetical protein
MNVEAVLFQEQEHKGKKAGQAAFPPAACCLTAQLLWLPCRSRWPILCDIKFLMLKEQSHAEMQGKLPPLLLLAP